MVPLDFLTGKHQNPSTNPSKPRKQHTPEFKAQAIELLALGRPVTELAEELCVSANLLYSWKSSSHDPRALRREIALLRQKNEIFKKAAVILGAKPRPNSRPKTNLTIKRILVQKSIAPPA